jgi:hypothetical protein
MSFNSVQSRAVTGLLTGHITLRRHFHLMGLIDSPLCRKSGAEDENSAHILDLDKNSIQEEIKRKLKSGNACYNSVHNFLSSSLLSKNIKFKIYGTII